MRYRLFLFLTIFLIFAGTAIADCSLTNLVHPKGGEILSRVQTIQWQWNDPVQCAATTVEIQYSEDGGDNYIKIADSGAGATSYDWDTTTVADKISYKIRVKRTGSNKKTSGEFMINNNIENLIDDLNNSIQNNADKLNSFFAYTIADNTADVWNNGIGTLSVTTNTASSCSYVNLFDSTDSGVLNTGDNLLHETNKNISENSIFEIHCIDNLNSFNKKKMIGVKYNTDALIVKKLEQTYSSFLLSRYEYENAPSLAGDFSTAKMLQSLGNNWNTVWQYDFNTGSWKSYTKGVGGTLQEFDASVGFYVVHMNAPSTLTIN